MNNATRQAARGVGNLAILHWIVLALFALVVVISQFPEVVLLVVVSTVFLFLLWRILTAPGGHHNR